LHNENARHILIRFAKASFRKISSGRLWLEI